MLAPDLFKTSSMSATGRVAINWLALSFVMRMGGTKMRDHFRTDHKGAHRLCLDGDATVGRAEAGASLEVESKGGSYWRWASLALPCRGLDN